MRFFGFMREVFSENGSGSFSRVASGLHVAAAVAWGTHFVWHTHAIPDAITLGGLSAFATAPYVVGKGLTAFGKNPSSGQAPAQP